MKNELYDTIIEIVAVIIIVGIALLMIIAMTKSAYDYTKDVQMRWCLKRYYSYDYCKERYRNNE
mgnify:CR=1 FL=1